MAHHFYLPQLTEENISTPNEYGHWFNNEKKIILGISDAILVDENALTRGVSSIPDIWARPLLFQSAVKPQSKHPLNKRCIQEWRGLMSLLALHKIMPDLSALEIEPVSLNNETFSTALKNLSPSSVQLEDGKFYEWNHILMIRFDGIPLGAFSPTTLVFTGSDYSRKLIDKAFPLKDELGFLTPPKSKKEGIENIGEWLLNLQAQLNNVFFSGQSNRDHQIVGNINSLIDDWLKEIREILGISESEVINATRYKVSEDMLDIKKPAGFLSGYNVYKYLLQPLVSVSTSEDDFFVSDVALESTRNVNDFKKVIVINEKLLEEDIYLWGETRSKPLGESPKEIIIKYFGTASGTKIGIVDIGERGGMWIRPELFFLTEDLLKARQGEFLSENEKELNIQTRYVLPFKREILQFYSPKDIKDILNPVYKEDNGTVKFSFILPLIGNKKLKVEKIYREKGNQLNEGRIIESDIPIIEIFPNYLGENWRKYYLFQGQAENFNILPIFGSGNVTKTTREREAKYLLNENTGEFTTLSNARKEEFKYREISQKVRISELAGENCFPEGLAIVNDKNTPTGLVLIEHNELNQGLKHNWTIGIDFGTSNTNVYRNRGTADTAERWVYDFPGYSRSISLSNGNIRKIILQEYFFPTSKINLPIPTTLKIYDLAKKENLVLDYFIYFPIEYKYPENVLSDIKWDGEGERKTEYFLESILFLLLIEVVRNGVAKVQLACSYPKAFSETNINVFKREWETVFDKLLMADENFNLTSESKNMNAWILNIHSGKAKDNEKKIMISKPVFKTEGIAAGEYFASELTIKDINERANKEIAAICLDVGGATTDISIWYLNNIEFDASVLLAGRQISNLLQNNNRVRELLFTKDAAIALEEKKNEPGYFSARLNLVLKNEEDRIQEMLVKHANNKDIQWLRQIIALEFGALCFYAAQVCVSTDDKVGGLLSRIADDGINLHWGGNAAKLINWIDFGRYSRDGIASKILNALFFNCLNDKSLVERSVKAKALSQLQSPGHKSEASGGMVVMNLDQYRNDEKGVLSSDINDDFLMPEDVSDNLYLFAGTVCGENIDLVDNRIAFYTPITNNMFYDINNRTKFKTTSLDRLVRFVEVLNFFGIKNGLFTEDTKIVLGESEKRIIRDGVMKEFIRMQSLKESQRLIEPVFIIEIKILLEIIKAKMK